MTVSDFVGSSVKAFLQYKDPYVLCQPFIAKDGLSLIVIGIPSRMPCGVSFNLENWIYQQKKATTLQQNALKNKKS